MEKNLFKKIVKHEKLLSLINSKLSSIREIINKSLRDNKIDEEEYKYVHYEFNQYKLMKADTLSSNEKNAGDASRQNVVTREEMEQYMEESLRR